MPGTYSCPPPDLILWCEHVNRVPHDWRGKNAEHSITFKPGDPFPDTEFVPCPADGCDGRCKARAAPKEKKCKAHKNKEE